MIKYYKKGCDYNWSDGCYAAGMKLHYHSYSITDIDERTKKILEASIYMDILILINSQIIGNYCFRVYNTLKKHVIIVIQKHVILLVIFIFLALKKLG